MKKLSSERKEEILLTIELWRESGLSQNEFCRTEGINRSSFQRWRRRYDPSYESKGSKTPKSIKKDESTSSSSGFLSIEMSSTASSTESSSVMIEIRYPNGTELRYPISLSVLDLQKLLLA